jgi:hypothetical protein
MEVLTETMQGFKYKTTAGTDGVNKELFKYAFQKVLICFTDLANIYRRYKHVLKQRNIVLIAPIYKEDRQDFKQKHTYKDNHMKINATSLCMLEEVHNEFRKGQSRTHCIFNIIKLMRK